MLRNEPTSRLKLASPDITALELDAVADVMRSGVLALGPAAVDFEQAIARAMGRRFGIACSSGTAGLHLAVRALGIGDGEEVITTPFSFVASANCMLYERAVPRFVDIEEETLGLDPALVEAAGNGRTRGILPVDVFGHPCRLDELEAIATQHNWALIEDACEALGSRLNGRSLGSWGEVSVLAFYPNKQITTGEGGMVLVDDPELASSIRSMRNQGRDEDGTWLRHVRLGFNYRMDELSAALGLAQFHRLEELRTGRARVVRSYAQLLGEHEWVRIPREAPGAEVDWFVYVVRLAETIDRDALIPALAARGVPARPYFSPLHLQPLYRDLLNHRPGDFPVTERVAASTLALPYSSRMSDDDVQRVVEALVASIDRAMATGG